MVVPATLEVAGNSCVLSVASVKTITVLLYCMPRKRTLGNLRNGIPFLLKESGDSLTNKKGHLFHVTNTNAIISLNNVNLVNEDPAKVLLSVCAEG